jgi:hypothetical protein
MLPSLSRAAHQATRRGDWAASVTALLKVLAAAAVRFRRSERVKLELLILDQTGFALRFGQYYFPVF